MTRQEILNDLISIVSRINSKPSLKFDQVNEKTLISSLGLNSLQYIRMVVLIENKFDIKIYDMITAFNDQDTFTVGNLCDCILNLL